MDGMTKQLENILNESVNTIERNTDRYCREAASESVAKLKATSPKKRYNGGRYASGWTYEPIGAGHKGIRLVGYVVRNATDYQLTHLLENGHALWNGTRRVRARKHIAPVEKEESAKLLSKLTNVAR